MVRPLRFQGSIPGRQSQWGVAAIYAAFSLIAGVSAMALAIDTGQLYYAQRDLEKLAGTAALDATRAAAGCFVSGNGAPPTPSSTVVMDAVAASIQRNLDASVAKDLTKASDFMQPVSGVSTVEVGMMDLTTVRGTRTFTPTGASGLDSNGTDAIRVNLARKQPTPLIPFIFSTATDGSSVGLLRASASAQQTPAASYSIGSTLLNVSNPPLLNALFSTLFGPLGGPTSGPPLNISAASFMSLASASVTLGGIAAQLGLAPSSSNGTPVGTLPPSVVNASVSVQSVLSAEAAVLTQQGQTNAANAIAAIAAITDPSQSTSLGALSGVVDPVRNGVLGALPISAFDLLTSLGNTVKSGLYPIKLVPSVNLPANLANTDIFLTIGDPGHPNTLGHAGFDGNGNPRTTNNTAQVTLMLRQKITVGLPALPLLGTLTPLTVRLGTDVSVASATSFLSAISCPSGVTNMPTQASVDVTTAPATVAIGTFTDGAESAPVTPGPLATVKVPLLGTITINTNGLIPAQPIAKTSEETRTFSAPYPAAPQTAGGNVNNLNIGAAVLNSVQALNLTTCINANCLGGPLPSIPTLPTVPSTGTPLDLVAQAVQATVSGVISGSTIDSTVNTLLAALGATAGSATVTMQAVNFRNSDITVTNDKSTISVPRLFNLDNSVPVASSTR